MPGEGQKYVYWVHLVAGHGDAAKLFSVVFESHLPSVAEIEAVLHEHGVTTGSRLFTVDDGRDGRMIRDRKDFMFGAAGLVSLQPYNRKVWEPEE